MLQLKKGQMAPSTARTPPTQASLCRTFAISSVTVQTETTNYSVVRNN